MLLDGWGAPASIKSRSIDDDGDEYMLGNEDDQQQDKPKLTKKSKLGGFHSMAFSKSVFDGIMRVGYKAPTPIQRSAIPVILSGQDVVAMARTGSGKTACFLLPMFEALKTHSVNMGPRALILEPTRELAEQTLKFAVKLGKFTGLHCTLVVGGDSMDGQFGALHKHPDIVIATPGRLMHVCVEMNLRLDNVEYVVFDEADRLFEMGFREQMEEVLARLAITRQTLLFSATLPQMLADFAKAGLVNPVMIRLDKDDKLSEHLKVAFFSVPSAFKLHLLLYIIRNVVRPTEQLIVFVATQLHVQYLEAVFEKMEITCTYLYSAMDPTSRRINAAKFQKKIVNVLIATDIAARGIDIPNLDYVINYNFPGTSKIFVHRVGRAARAGKSGTAFSFVSSEEEAYLWDLHKFLGRSVLFSPKCSVGVLGKALALDMQPHSFLKNTEQSTTITESSSTPSQEINTAAAATGGKRQQSDLDCNFQFGTIPTDIIGEEAVNIDRLKDNSELVYLGEKKDNAQRLYERTRPKPSREALREMKEMKQLTTPGQHPILKDSVGKCLHVAIKGVTADMMERKMMIMEQLRNIRLKKNTFEVGSAGSKQACRNMRAKRKRDDAYIASYHLKLQVKRAKYEDLMQFKATEILLPQMDEDDIYYEFPRQQTTKDDLQAAVDAKNRWIREKKERDEERERKKADKLTEKIAKKEANTAAKDNARKEGLANNVKAGFFIPYQPADVHTEKGYSMSSNFSQQTKGVTFELQQDDYAGMARQKMIKKWDGKKMKFAGPKTQEKKIKTESGRIIRSSYKTDRYNSWLKRNKMDETALEAVGGAELDQEKEELQEEGKHKKFQVLSTKSDCRTHPLLQEKNKKLIAHGNVVRDELRNKQQLKKHIRLQKKYAADRERGQEMKKLKAKLSGVRTKPMKKSVKNAMAKKKKTA